MTPYTVSNPEMTPAFAAWSAMDRIAAEIARRNPEVPPNLDSAIDGGATYCEQTRHFERWTYDDSESAWYCRDCGHLVEDTDDGCAVCGYGDPELEDA